MPTRKNAGAQPGPKSDAVIHGEQRSGAVAGITTVVGPGIGTRNLAYALVDGEMLFEGDIVLGSGAQGDSGVVVQSVGITGQQFRWPNATIPFEIDPALPNPQRVTDAIAHWQANTRMRFVARTAAHANFVRFVPGGGCSSQVGMRGGQQNITLGPNCTTGNCIHEIGHTVGLWHEQSREDRNTFVDIVFANIDPAMQHNFTQQISDGDDLGGYDYGSIMHYPRNAFTINGQDTIVPKQALPPGVVMGQRAALSAGDIAGVHMMYPAPTPTFKEVPKDPVQETVKEVRKDPIRDTLKEIRKDPIRDTLKEVRKEPVLDPIPKGFDPPFPGPRPRFPLSLAGSQSPFVLAGGSRVPGGQGDAQTAQADYVQQLADAITQLEQQLAELMAAYEAAVSDLQGMG